MGRKILFVTTDQQRYDTLGCNGGAIARTPVVDALAAAGHRYERAQPQSVVCMPSRSTMITGQHPSTHGVWMNGVPLPVDAPSVAAVLHDAGYRTALVGKPHFEPFLDPFARFAENRFARDGQHGVHRGFEHFEAATHSGAGPLHYARWLAADHPEAVGMFYPVLDGSLEVNAAGGGETGAPQVHDNTIPRVVPHRLGGRPNDRLARLARRRRRLVLLDELSGPAPPMGPAGLGAGPRRLARRAPAGWVRRGRGRARARPRRQAPPLAGVVRRPARLQLRGTARLGASHPDRRPGARGQRPQRRRVRADR